MTERKGFLFNQIFGESPPNVNDVPEGEFKKTALDITQTFDAAVDYMRTEFPDDGIKELMTMFWRSVGNKITPVGVTDKVPSMGFWAEAIPTGLIGYVLVPPTWNQMVESDTNLQLGAMVFTASQVKDYNQVLESGNLKILIDRLGMVKRAKIWEARYLKKLQELDPDYSLNEYQLQILDRFSKNI